MKKLINYKIASQVNQGTKSSEPLIELTAEQKQRLQTVAGTALAIVAGAGIIAVAAAAPNIFQALDKIYNLTKGKKYSFKEKQLKTVQTFYYLKKHGLIQIKSTKKGLFAQITKKGQLKIKDLNFQTLQIKHEPKWDKKWWLIAADIPTKDYRWAADLFRNKIKQMGFYPLQRTLWLYPYDPIKEIEFISQHFGIAKFVTIMEVSRMDKDDESNLKKFFGL